MYKQRMPDLDGKLSVVVSESYEGEAQDLFDKADIDAEEPVDVLYCIDQQTEEQIELWRKDWIND